MHLDATTSINELKEMVRQFINERNWEKYHTPRNIAVSVTLEAAELLEHFQWSPPAEDAIDQKKRHEIGEEMADVMAYLLSLANVLDIDIASTMKEKMKKNRSKYPAEQFQGNWNKPEAIS